MFKIPNILNPQIIFETNSPVSGEIKVVQIGKERRLMVGGYVQSINGDCPGVEKRVWGKIVLLGMETCPNLKNILLLGLGGGTIVSLLKKHKPKSNITAIEIDPKIIAVAKKFFSLSEVARLNLIEGDAYTFITKKYSCTNLLGKYDLVIVDVYCGGSFPQKFWGEKFFKSLKSSMGKGGCVIFNRILRTDVDFEINEAKGTLSPFFKYVSVHKVNIVGNSGNILFLCKN
ncbi:MAG: hypothetical protein ABIJ36_03355 [Patescibacteria group bacterium]|nr:hypothetical protein [Patescibacteria group bacterium]